MENNIVVTNNNSITASELYKTSALVSEIANKIKEANLSNIESIMYAYDILKKRLYIEHNILKLIHVYSHKKNSFNFIFQI